MGFLRCSAKASMCNDLHWLDWSVGRRIGGGHEMRMVAERVALCGGNQTGDYGTRVRDTDLGRPASHHQIGGRFPYSSPCATGRRTPHIWLVPPDWKDRSINRRHEPPEGYCMSSPCTTRTLLTLLVRERHRRPSLWRQTVLEEDPTQEPPAGQRPGVPVPG
jgi:hypothetical protein